MRNDKLKEMEKLLALNFERKRRHFSQVVAQEAQLRSKLDKLSDQVKDAEQSEHHQIRAIGADVIWKAWVNKTQRSLNFDLARILAQKESLIVAVRKDYGRLLASRELLRVKTSEEARATQKLALETICHDIAARKAPTE